MIKPATPPTAVPRERSESAGRAVTHPSGSRVTIAVSASSTNPSAERFCIVSSASSAVSLLE